MGVNTSLLPIKGHFFLYWGFISAVIPYMMVVARQLGVPVGVQGVVWAVITTLSLVFKPLLATLVDAHPTRRKMVFMVLLGTMVCATTPIGFIQPLYHHHDSLHDPYQQQQSSVSSSSSSSQSRGLMKSDHDPIPSLHTLNHQPQSSLTLNHQPQFTISGEMVISPTMGNVTTAYLLVQPNKERCEVVTMSWQCRASCYPHRQLCHQNNNKDDGDGWLRLSLLHGTHPARPTIITPQQHTQQNKLETTTEAAASPPIDERIHDVAEGTAENLLVYVIEGWQHYQETPDILNITVSCESGERGWGEEECGGGGRRDSGGEEGGGRREGGGRGEGGGVGGTSGGDVGVGGKRNVKMTVRGGRDLGEQAGGGGRIGDTGEEKGGGEHKTLDKHTQKTRTIKNHNHHNHHDNNEEVTRGNEGEHKSDRNVVRNIHNNNQNHNNNNYNNESEVEVDIKRQQQGKLIATTTEKVVYAEEVDRKEGHHINNTTTTTTTTKDDPPPQQLLLQPSVWTLPGFWLYLLLLLLGQIAATTVESVSDAICCDIIGDGGDYGGQRVWGLVSYGLLGLLSGCLVDFYSMDSTVKDYTPAFLLSAGCGVLDILLAGTRLKVPQADNNNKTKEEEYEEEEEDEREEGTEEEGGGGRREGERGGGRGKRGGPKSTLVWNKMKPLLTDHRVIVFLVLAFLIGFFDGLDTTYVFVLQEDMAEGTATMQHIKLLQGLTLLVQAVSAIPCMMMCDRLIKRLGSERVISLVVFLYSVRLLSLALASHMGAVWTTVAVEVINGPCFGLGYTAVVMHAAALSPLGTSTTMQSVVGVCYSTLGYATASLVGGVVYEGVGGTWLYLLTGILAAVTFPVHIIYLCLTPTTTPPEQMRRMELGVEFTNIKNSRETLHPLNEKASPENV
ncbi:hypothetical protein Pmani_002958 [Petrolisthes manimaculis]|uniref:Major facilitator superfamily (MFS) profile domain-containing protein n=1 Tax=Petrolisthes manimaculis TaxID=1843537 RepID=A0AAE1QHJ3_9EUCA|nr:hypothetical protein Pmani_002958 [Petrolisthes manimaculis]